MMGPLPVHVASSMLLALLLIHAALGAAPSSQATPIASALHRGPSDGDINGKVAVSSIEPSHIGSDASSTRGGSMGRRSDGGSAAGVAAAGPVVVSGATGRTGSLLYLALRSSGITVRALVRNASKAREMLDCGACDEEAGIFVGDITDPSTLSKPMRGARQLVILTSSYPQQLPNGSWYFPPGEYPRDIDWVGSNNQVRAALSAGVRHVLLVSSMGTTQPDTFLDKLGDGHALFYKLNGEADLMASGLPFTIIKPGGLLSTEGGQSLLLAGHDDELKHARVTRADLAAVLQAAIIHPELSTNLRFDLSSDTDRPPSKDFNTLFEDARAWGRKTTSV